MKATMKFARVVLAFVCVTNGNLAIAQSPDLSVYRVGRYAASPVFYPSALSENVVRDVLSSFEKISQEEVLRLDFDEDDSGNVIPNRLLIYTCSTEESCISGQLYRFENRAAGWVFIDERPGVWTPPYVVL